ncbi:hypothetical protein [Paenibacillus endoradicis]|uniref:hypothetical protein n=1 Tax=Paenibacillus endoradicis TaxID=2972487 RepID=UPI0021598054|nr:hypothetical protein [Paenibacillus endoradicis]MCR8659460.1 hypothetical protein [Paenibacillus endoradicis]
MLNQYPARVSGNQQKSVRKQGNNSTIKHDQRTPNLFMTAQMMQAQQSIGNKAIQQYMSSMYKENEPLDQQEQRHDKIMEESMENMSVEEILAMPPSPEKRNREVMERDLNLAQKTIDQILTQYDGSLEEVETYFPSIKVRFRLSIIEVIDRDTPEAYVHIKINPERKVKGSKAKRKEDERKAREKLEKVESRTTGAHFFSRHGAETTRREQRKRATTGETPDGVRGRAVDSSRFLSSAIELEVLQRAEKIHDVTKKDVFTFDLNYEIGEGYRVRDDKLVKTKRVTAVFRNGDMITLFPVIGE